MWTPWGYQPPQPPGYFPTQFFGAPEGGKKKKGQPSLKDYKNFIEFMEFVEERKTKNKKDDKKDDKKPDNKLTPGQVYMLLLLSVPIQFWMFSYFFLSLIQTLKK